MAGAVTTKEWSCSGGGCRGRAEREAPPAQRSWESLKDPRSSTELTATDMVRHGLLRPEALAVNTQHR